MDSNSMLLPPTFPRCVSSPASLILPSQVPKAPLSPLEEEVRKIVGTFRVPGSKTPVMDALICCALKGWGIRLTTEQGDDIRFYMDDYVRYSAFSALICSLTNPTTDHSARIKALRRWFSDLPNDSEFVQGHQPFEIVVERGDGRPRKVRILLKKMRALLADAGLSVQGDAPGEEKVKEEEPEELGEAKREEGGEEI